MLITMLNGCVQSEVNKKHAFEDTVEKKLPPSVIDLVNYPFRVTREEKTNALLRFRFGFLNADYYAKW